MTIDELLDENLRITSKNKNIKKALEILDVVMTEMSGEIDAYLISVMLSEVIKLLKEEL